MIPGERGARAPRGFCFSARSTAGGPRVNATSAKRICCSAFEQPSRVQSGEAGSGWFSRLVFNIRHPARCSGPLDNPGRPQRHHAGDEHRLDHPEWPRTPRRFLRHEREMAPKIGEEMSVRLPVFVALRRLLHLPPRSAAWKIFADDQVVRDFLGPFVPTVSSVDPKKPVHHPGRTMNDPDPDQQQESSRPTRSCVPTTWIRKVLRRIRGALRPPVRPGRKGNRMEDAEAALFIP